MNTSVARTAGVTPVHVDMMCECPFSIAQEYAVEYLKRAEAGGPESHIGVRLPGPFPRVGRKVALSFGLATDVTEPGRGHDEVRITWISGSALFPNFRGTVRFRIHGSATLLIVDGSYDPPLGVVGATFDRVIGRWLAAASVRNLAAGLRDELAYRLRAWRAAQVGYEFTGTAEHRS